MGPYSSLEAWKAAHELAIAVTRAAALFPPDERYELASQLRRAALSAPTNLAEGKARFGPREYLRFVRIAIGSIAEVEYLLYFAKEMGYLKEDEYRQLDELRRRTNILMSRLARGLHRPPS